VLNWWFKENHLVNGPEGLPQEFRYFFAQREVLETVVFLYDVVKVQNKYDLMRFDSSRLISEDKFDFLYVDGENFHKYQDNFNKFSDLLNLFMQYKE
jgi:hypothetical protein